MNEKIEHIINDAKKYAESHLNVTDNPPTWLRDALYNAYLSAAENILKIRILH